MHGKPGTVYAAFSYAEFESAVLRACREIDPSLLTPRSDVDGDITRIEGELTELEIKETRAKARLAKAKDADIEEIAIEQLATIKRERRELVKALDGLKAQKTSEPAAQMQLVHKLIDNPGEDAERTRIMVRGLIAALVEIICVYIQRKGHKQRRCWVLIKYKTGLWRKLFLQGGISVTMPDESPSLDIPSGGGWE